MRKHTHLCTFVNAVRPKIHTEDVMYFKVDDKMSEVESVGGETSIGLCKYNCMLFLFIFPDLAVDWVVGVPEVKVESQYKASTSMSLSIDYFSLCCLCLLCWSEDKYCPCVNMLVPIKRLYGYYLARVFLVLYFLIIMSWSTFSMGPDEFGDRMSINLTLFLSAVCCLTSISVFLLDVMSI